MHHRPDQVGRREYGNDARAFRARSLRSDSVHDCMRLRRANDANFGGIWCGMSARNPPAPRNRSGIFPTANGFAHIAVTSRRANGRARRLSHSFRLFRLAFRREARAELRSKYFGSPCSGKYARSDIERPHPNPDASPLDHAMHRHQQPGRAVSALQSVSCWKICCTWFSPLRSIDPFEGENLAPSALHR